MKYYSDKTLKMYDTVEDLESDEAAFDIAKKEEIEEKKAIIELAHSISADKKQLQELLAAYMKKYQTLSLETETREDEAVIRDALRKGVIYNPEEFYPFNFFSIFK